MEGAEKVVAIERDARCLEALAEIAAHYPGRLEVIEGDVLATDYRALAPAAGPVRIVANLPYNIATPLLIGWLQTEPWPPFFDRMTLMFQREVAERIVATPDDDAYGRLAVLAGWRAEARLLFDISPKAFTPPPKVVSSVVELIPRVEPLPCDRAALGARHGGRLRPEAEDAAPEPQEPRRRSIAAFWPPQAWSRRHGRKEIDVAGFVRLANALSAQRAGEPGTA